MSEPVLWPAELGPVEKCFINVFLLDGQHCVGSPWSTRYAAADAVRYAPHQPVYRIHVIPKGSK